MQRKVESMLLILIVAVIVFSRTYDVVACAAVGGLMSGTGSIDWLRILAALPADDTRALLARPPDVSRVRCVEDIFCLFFKAKKGVQRKR